MYELRIDFTYTDGSSFYALYSLFRVSDEFSFYRLAHLGLFSGNATFTTCPSNKEYKTCTCEKSCENPDVCLPTCTEDETCICPDGYYLKGAECVPQEECGCFIGGNLIAEGGFYVNSDCSRRCNCSAGQLVCDDDYQCSSNAVCEERDGVRQCYCNPGYTGEECGCFMGGNLIAEGGFYVNSDCSRRCNCSAGQLVCDDDYQCSSNAVCEERDGVRQCYCNPGYTGDGVTCTSNSSTATDCLDVFNNGNTGSGVYNIKPVGWSGSPFEVYCNMTDGGGWTVFQRRVDGSVDFHVYWDDYKDGFGSPDHELWMGNEKLFSLTNQKRYQLRIDFVNRYGAPYYAKYDYFRINNEANNYRLTIGTYSGDAGDSLTTYHNNEDFSTRDRDNDDSNYNNWASYSYGAWWYRYYFYCALNANYDTGNFYWYTLPGNTYNIRFTEMKVRPV
ncbi:Fibrinogen C domain-containing protein 1-A [Holothuria leucospilota]|uniref:Fibrinogen C domain-containing protein 1-A n=1 Tax=Holothuria leucospilota TaxID=206669 RepID=A0A9Q1H623_HOLLE|nr:Fibrinogen C domain-containing protein 1-A [Holothuria leucospilota]